ncbi:MAG: hypothetical protein LIO96_10580 [Lachnospiraceae bacterium]|nr:hypothetical protein [Lachnospiraceae bacterium]
MFSCIKTELKKLFSVPNILLTASGILVLLLSATGATVDDGSEVSIFAMMISGTQSGYRESIEGSSLWLWRQGTGSWLAVFLPLLLSFGYITLLSSERLNGQLRFLLIRSGNRCYCVSKVISGAVFGGILFLLSYCLFGLLMAAAFPSFSSFPAEEQNFYLNWIFGESIPLYIIKRAAGAFLYGASGSAFGIGVSIFFRDKYMLICLPFLLNYSLRQILLKLEMGAWAAGTESTPFYEALFPDNLLNVVANPYWFLTLLLTVLVFAGLTVLFCRITLRKVFTS